MPMLRFGLFELDTGTKELRRDGALVRLQTQPALVLGTLVERAGEVVSREELRHAVWQDDTFVDFERGLNFCVAQIRSALNDDASEPRFIRTIPKRGYQFIAPVVTVGDAAASAPVQSGPTPARRTAYIVLLLSAVLSAGYWWKVRTPAEETPIVAVMRFDNETGNLEMTRFSDALTDVVVAELAAKAGGNYQVAGNARILRVPRSERDLGAVRSSLKASFVVIGQVQKSGDQLRILAHLIHLPDQTHIWVVRREEKFEQELELEARFAETTAAEFSSRIRPNLNPAASHPTASF